MLRSITRASALRSNCSYKEGRILPSLRLFSKSNTLEQEYPPNSSLTITSVENRNPRNLEKLRIGEKPGGWNLDKPGKNFWNKVLIEMTGKHVEARVMHYTGLVPVRASTKEWCIKKDLYSTKDTAAVETVGRVLAQRCLEVGLTEVYCYFPEDELNREKIQTFVKAMEKGGVTLKEPEQLDSQEWIFLMYRKKQEKAWEVLEEIDEKLISKSKYTE